MTQFFTFINTIWHLLKQVMSSLVGMTEALIGGGTVFATVAQFIIPGYAIWFVAAMLAIPVVIIIINIFRDFL